MQWLIAAPANNERGPRYMEKALAAIHQAGLRQTPISLVYGAVGGEIGVLLTCTRAQQERVLGPIAANYPQCSISAVDDDTVRPGLAIWFVDLNLQPELFPILRHAQFEDLLNHNFADPVSSLLHAIRPDELLHCRVEITILPASRHRCHAAAGTVKLLDREFFRRHHRLAAYFARNSTRGRVRWLAWLLGRMAVGTPSPSRTALETSTSRLHEREEDLQAAADKIGGHLFEARVRLIAAAPPDRRAEAHDRLRSMAGAFGAFTRSRLATFRATKPRHRRSRRSGRSFLLSHEELATLWHPPTATASAERMKTSEFTELEPPAVLHSEEEEGTVALGRVRFREDQRLVCLALEDRRRHAYVVGKTGMGKSNLIQNKIRPFLTSTHMRAIVSQPGKSLDLREIMDDGKVLIINLSKGRVGEDNSTLLGAFLVTSIQQAAMTRADVPEASRRDFFLYVDEFQNFTTGSFASVLSEARKFRLSLIVAHQYLAQLNEQTADAVWGNVGSIVAFQVGSDDAETLAQQLGKHAGQLTPENLTGLPKYVAYARLLIDGLPSSPFSIQTLPPPKAFDPARAEIIRRVARRRIAGPRTEEPIPV